MFISAATANKVYELASKDFIYKEVLRKYFPNKSMRTEFEQEAWLYLLEHPDKTVEVWNKKFFHYYFIALVKNQVLSNSSNWHLNFRKYKHELLDIMPEESIEENPFQEQDDKITKAVKEKKLEIIDAALNHFLRLDPYFKPSADVFRLHYYEGMSIRQISKQFYDEPTTSVWELIKNAEVLVKGYVRKYHSNIDWDSFL